MSTTTWGWDLLPVLVGRLRRAVAGAAVMRAEAADLRARLEMEAAGATVIRGALQHFDRDRRAELLAAYHFEPEHLHDRVIHGCLCRWCLTERALASDAGAELAAAVRDVLEADDASRRTAVPVRRADEFDAMEMDTLIAEAEETERRWFAALARLRAAWGQG